MTRIGLPGTGGEVEGCELNALDEAAYDGTQPDQSSEQDVGDTHTRYITLQ